MKYLRKFNEELEEKNFQEVFNGYEGYHIYINSDQKTKIKNDLGIGDEDIKIVTHEAQEDRSYWVLSIKININALDEDKKKNFIEIIKKIVLPPAPKNIPVVKKSGLFDKIKSAF